jgi:cold shock CspA family protein
MQFDNELDRFIRGQYSPPTRQISAPNRKREMEGVIIKKLPTGSIFITPDNCAATDRNASVFCHFQELIRSGLKPADLMAGARLGFDQRASRVPDRKPEACNVTLLAA